MCKNGEVYIVGEVLEDEIKKLDNYVLSKLDDMSDYELQLISHYIGRRVNCGTCSLTSKCDYNCKDAAGFCSDHVTYLRVDRSINGCTEMTGLNYTGETLAEWSHQYAQSLTSLSLYDWVTEVKLGLKEGDADYAEQRMSLKLAMTRAQYCPKSVVFI